MNILSKLSGHWTDDQLIASLYDVGPEDGHLGGCAKCQSRLSAMRASRQTFAHDECDPSLLASQRRRIYARMQSSLTGPGQLSFTRWVAVAAGFAILGGSLAIHQRHEQQCLVNQLLSDAQLTQDVSNMSGGADEQPAEPIMELFTP
jgi:hypothetical protein